MNTSKLYFLRTITPTHFGTGRGAGSLDLPIARETSTQLPVAPGTGVKGVLREHFREDPLQTALFGPDRDKAAQAGILSPQDACLLCLPVRSARGTCAWVASPMTLMRYAREARVCNVNVPDSVDIPDNEIAAGPPVSFSAAERQDEVVVLHELARSRNASFEKKRADWADHIATKYFVRDLDVEWRRFFAERFVIASDDTLLYLTEMATDVRARVALDEQRVVIDGANWYEESLPAETLLWGVVGAQWVRQTGLLPQDALDKLKPARLQMGGKATVGRGVVEFLI